MGLKEVEVVILRDEASFQELERLSRVPNFSNGRWLASRKQESDYLNAALEDLRSFADFFFAYSRVTDAGYPNQNIEFLVSDSTSYGAWSQFTDGSRESGSATVTLGSSLALDDLFFRCASNHGFFAPEEVLLKGQEPDEFKCVWPEKTTRIIGKNEDDVLRPKLRFGCYDEARLSTRGEELLKSGAGSYLSRFFSAIPVCEDRFWLARTMSMIAHGWLFIHEEEHFSSGHLKYLTDEEGLGRGHSNVKIGAATTRSDASLGEGCRLARKVIEWHADHGATNGVMDVMFKNRHFITNILGYGFDSKKSFLRLLMTSIGTVMLHFQFLETLHGRASHYPTAHTRLSTLFFTIAKLIRVTRKRWGVEDVDFAVALLLSIEDLVTVSQILGVQNVSKRAGVPMYGLEDEGEHARLGLFDQELDICYYQSKVLRELGFEIPNFLKKVLGSLEVSPPRELSNSYDEKWFSEYCSIIKEFDEHYIHEFDIRRPTLGTTKKILEHDYSKSRRI